MKFQQSRSGLFFLVILVFLALGTFYFESSKAQDNSVSGAENQTIKLFELIGTQKNQSSVSIAGIREQEIAINFDAVNLETTQKLHLPLLDGKLYEAVRGDSEGFERFAADEYTWRGKIFGENGWSGDVILTVKDRSMSGLIYSPGGVYEILPRDLKHILVLIDQSRFPPCGNGDSEGSQLTGQSRGPGGNIEKLPDTQSVLDDGTLIDVLVVYSVPVRTFFGGTSQTQAFIQQAIATANTAYQNSGINPRLRLASTLEVSYADNGTSSSALDWVESNSTVATARNNAKADLVAFIIENSESGNCGVAHVMRSVGSGFSEDAFSVTKRSCAVGNLTFAHELGHNQGCEHNPENGASSNEASYPYAFGHYVNGSFRTVMSYADPCSAGCNREPYFSNPAVTFNGSPTGISNQRDNHRVINNTALTISQFRDGGGASCSSGTSTLRNRDNGPPIHPPGSLIKVSSNSTVYLIDSDNRRRPLSASAMSQLYNQSTDSRSSTDFTNWVITVGQEELDLYELGGSIVAAQPGNAKPFPDGKLIGYNGEVSIVTGVGKRRPFVLESTFTGLGFKFCQVVNVSQSEYNSYPLGPTVEAMPLLTSSVSLFPAGPYTVGQNITGSFTIKNVGYEPIPFASLGIGGRFNGSTVYDLGFTSTTLAAGSSYAFGSQAVQLTSAGTYDFFAAYQENNGHWSISVPAAPSVVRSRQITVSASSAPAAPTANGATNVTNSGFIANWSSSNGATGYRLDVSPSNTFGSFVSGYQNLDVGNVLNRSVSGLSSGTTYFYRVRAYNGSGTSSNSGTISVTTTAAQNYTISLSASPAAGGTVSGAGTFAAGSSRTVTASANSGYTFTNWSEGGSVVSSSASYTFTLNSNRTLVANFTTNTTSNQATYDSGLMAPKCGQVGSSCDSGTLLDGRDNMSGGPEPNQPNTINNSCADGTSGNYHSDESIDSIKVSTLDGSTLASGKTVRIDVRVWAWTGPTEDHLDLYYTTSTSNPTWVYIATLEPLTAGSQVLSTTYTLPGGSSLQAVRAIFRYHGAAFSCATNSGFDDYDDLVFSVNSTSSCETVWFDDAVPAGATPYASNDGWNWVSSNPSAQSGSLAHQSALLAGLHDHYFLNATATLPVNTGDVLTTYVYLDPASPPQEIMLSFNDGDWGYRAYWGANLIAAGTDGTNSRRYMGPLPAAGQWVRLDVPASQVGLEGRTLSGMSFLQYGGRATWDRVGKSCTAPPPPCAENLWFDDSLPAGSTPYPSNDGWNWVGSNPSPNSGSVAHQSAILSGMHDHYFLNAANQLSVGAGSNLFAYVYLDPVNTPQEIMLSFNNGNWGFRAYWGANLIAAGTDGTISRRSMGTLPPAGQWVRLEVPASLVGLEGQSLSGMSFLQYGGRATWDKVGTIPACNPVGDTIWGDDAVPTGAIAVNSNDGWNWVDSSPAPFSGALAHRSSIVTGVHDHYFINATQTLPINAGDNLIAYVYLDPANPPQEIMLSWNDGNWGYRAYWGANLMPYGTDGTISRRYIGPLPPSGQWVRLEVPANFVGLEGHTLTGMSFLQYDGRATWDHAGKSRPGP